MNRIPPSTHQRGVALIIVLAFLVLFSAVTVAFLTSSQNEIQSSRTYESSISVKQLVGTANHVVMGQLSDATRSSTTGAAPTNASDTLTWASQPGLIRTWDATGKGYKTFKLYSSPNMVVDTEAAPYIPSLQVPGDGRKGVEIPADWPSKGALFTDLNSPVLTPDDKGEIRLDDSSTKYRASYPIVDGSAIKQVDGFDVKFPPGFQGTLDVQGRPVVDGKYNPTQIPSEGKSGNPVPMPVSWMYVLRDGTLTAPTGSEDDGQTATWAGATEEYTPSKENPIVGRIAFWTDDESSKLNVNTSSEPTPWDTPRAVNLTDLRYGQFQPAQREFQRFPGHPYMTALSPVLFPTQLPGSPVGAALTFQQKEAIYSLLPRVQPGGTRGATTPGTAAIGLDQDRLFASVDEFLFQPPATGGTTRRSVRDNPALNVLKLDTNRLRRGLFFLTANSRAPEVNLFGRPRIGLWPIPQAVSARRPFDKLAAFCTTLGTNRAFYFQRNDSKSPINDYTSIARNKALYEWLQDLTNRDVPGYGGNFKAKWTPSERNQVLTEIFDYIKTVNLKDPQTGATPFAVNGQVTPIRIVDSSIPEPHLRETRGFGRIHTISQVGIHFICSQDGAEGVRAKYNDKLAKDKRLIEAAILIQPFSPSHGWYKMNEELYYEVEIKTPLTVDAQDLRLPASTRWALTDRINDGWHNNGRERGGSGGLRGPIQALGGGNYALASTGRATIDASADKMMDFSGGKVTIYVYSGSTSNPANLLQTFTIDMPQARIPIPDLVKTGTDAFKGDGASAKEIWWTFRPDGTSTGRFGGAGAVPHAPGNEYFDPKRRWADSGGPPGFKKGGLFRAEDVVRTMVPEHGDIRLTAALSTVNSSAGGGPANVFVPVKDWTSNERFQHVFSEAAGTHLLYGFANEPGPSPAPGIPAAASDDQLVPSPEVTYHYSRMPEIRPGAGKAYNKWNDYDNGIAQYTDGAYINKPDEGNTQATNSQYAYWSWNFIDPLEVNFSPSRLVPSAGMLGSLPTGVKRGQPWQTLLFRPEVDIQGKPVHPGQKKGEPKDHLIMDLFWTPAIEPYAISEPFSTAGKVNVNYEIAPFTYIRRATALYGAMKSEEILAIPNTASKFYKLWDHESNDNPKLPSDAANQDPQVRADWTKAFNGQAPFDKMRRKINMEETLAQFDERFAKGEILRSATEICEMHLVREGETLKQYRGNEIWPKHLVTGENTRERPYANLYGRLTSKSNTFTVHVRAQTLRKVGSSDANDWAVWKEGRDQQLSEHRGSSIIERYIDPADPELPDFADKNNSNAVLDKFYRFRTVTTKKFVP